MRSCVELSSRETEEFGYDEGLVDRVVDVVLAENRPLVSRILSCDRSLEELDLRQELRLKAYQIYRYMDRTRGIRKCFNWLYKCLWRCLVNIGNRLSVRRAPLRLSELSDELWGLDEGLERLDEGLERLE